jgi:hypothetical protein
MSPIDERLKSLNIVLPDVTSDGKFRTGMYKASPEHQECKSG